MKCVTLFIYFLRMDLILLNLLRFHMNHSVNFDCNFPPVSLRCNRHVTLYKFNEVYPFRAEADKDWVCLLNPLLPVFLGWIQIIPMALRAFLFKINIKVSRFLKISL